MIGIWLRWRASSCGQTYPTTFPRWFLQMRRQWGKSFQLQSSDISYRTPNSIRLSKYFRDRPSCCTPTGDTRSSVSCLRLNNFAFLWMEERKIRFVNCRVEDFRGERRNKKFIYIYLLRRERSPLVIKYVAIFRRIRHITPGFDACNVI